LVVLSVFCLHLFCKTTFRDKWHWYFYRLDAIAVTQPTVSKHQPRPGKIIHWLQSFLHIRLDSSRKGHCSFCARSVMPVLQGDSLLVDPFSYYCVTNSNEQHFGQVALDSATLNVGNISHHTFNMNTLYCVKSRGYSGCGLMHTGHHTETKGNLQQM